MEWLEVSIEAGARGTESLCCTLDELGVSGLVIEDGSDLEDFIANYRQYWDYIDEELTEKLRDRRLVKFYLSDDESGRAELDRLRPLLEKEGYSAAIVPLRDEDWENNWKLYYKPMKIGKRLLVVPEWEAAPEPEERTVLRLNPGLSFGTGSHPSTRMCLEALEDRAEGAGNALDLGCGSGILAIAALKLGTKTALGCDIDEKAASSALENAALNGIGGGAFEVYNGDALADEKLRARIGAEKWELVFANIVADVIIALCPDVSRWLSDGGFFICSGIIDGRENEVLKTLDAAGLTVIESRREENWRCFTARKA